MTEVPPTAKLSVTVGCRTYVDLLRHNLEQRFRMTLCRLTSITDHRKPAPVSVLIELGHGCYADAAQDGRMRPHPRETPGDLTEKAGFHLN